MGQRFQVIKKADQVHLQPVREPQPVKEYYKRDIGKVVLMDDGMEDVVEPTPLYDWCSRFIDAHLAQADNRVVKANPIVIRFKQGRRAHG